MISGLGTDIIEVARIQAAIEKHGQPFLDRMFTRAEQEYCLRHKYNQRHFAGRFAAKEAVVKAFGTGFGKEFTFLDIEILNDLTGKPLVFIRNEPRVDVLVSISHCRCYATATAVKLDE